MSSRRTPNRFMAVRSLLCVLVVFCSNAIGQVVPATTEQKPDQRPNILWITVEDMSPQLGCYGDSQAKTPHLDEFARHAVRYQNAFATAPVCSPARSCLITGLYATSLGTQRLRSHFPVPDWCRPFPQYLREAGYFTTNNVKTDYNVRDEAAMIRAAWDRSSSSAHWRDRSPDQPFFSVINLMTTHQSRTCVYPFEQFEREVGSQLSPEQRHDPSDLVLPPYYPDTPLVRRTWARYYDCITAMDQQVGQILRDLEEDGLADNTIVFFYSDHGMGMPRGKRVLHDSGMRVAMLVRFPEKYQHLAPSGPGTTTDRLVSFVDFAPTVLSIAGLHPPGTMQGAAFLGSWTSAPRQYVFGARDRVDEVYDLSRSVRDDRYLYIRNYMPHQSWMPPEYYSDQAEMRRELATLRDAGQLDEAQMTYAAPRRSQEELYDTWSDPHQLRNLAESVSHQSVLQRMRSQLGQWVRSTRDVGFLPESMVWSRLNGVTPWDLARDPSRYSLEKILHAAEQVGSEDAIQEQIRWLSDSDPAVRYWAAVGLKASTSADPPVLDALRVALEDPTPSVRIEAAGALAGLGDSDLATHVLLAELDSEQPEVVLHAIRTLQRMPSLDPSLLPTVEKVKERAAHLEETSEDPCWMFVRFSAEAILQR